MRGPIVNTFRTLSVHIFPTYICLHLSSLTILLVADQWSSAITFFPRKMPLGSWTT